MGRNRGPKNGRTRRPQASLGGSPEIEMLNISCLGLPQLPWRAAGGPTRCGTRGPQRMHHDWPPPILGGRLVRRRKPFQDWELRLGYPDTFRTRCRTICRARTPWGRRKSLAGKDFGPRKNAFYGLFVRHRCRTRPPKEAYALRRGGDEVRGASARQVNHVRHESPNAAPQKSIWIITVLWNKRKRFWKITQGKAGGSTNGH